MRAQPGLETNAVPDLLIGCDVGTSSAKAILVDTSGDVLARERCDYPMHRPHPGWAENDPEDWVAAVETMILGLRKQVTFQPADLRALAIVAQRDPIVFLDENLRVLGPSVSWIDMRDLAETEQIYQDFGRQALIETTGLIPVPGLALPVIYWVRRHRPALWRKTKYILAAKDFILLRLTGQRATDTSLPARSMLYDLRKLDWSDWICAKAGIAIDLLPPVSYRPWESWGRLRPEIAARLGLKESTVVAAGGADDTAATLGGGGYRPGDVVVGTGTAACWRVVTNKIAPDIKERADLSPHVVPDHYVYEFVITGTGTSLRWFRESFFSDSAGIPASYEDLLAEAARVPPGAKGLMFFPFLEGARAPRYNDNASGVFFGIRAFHDRAHFVRAILEGIAFQYPLVLEEARRFDANIADNITLVDDEARSSLWNQIKADVTGVSITTLKSHNAAAMGAAILAALAAHLFPTVTSAVDSMVKRGHQVPPCPKSNATYRVIRERYEIVYRHLSAAFKAAAKAPVTSSLKCEEWGEANELAE